MSLGNNIQHTLRLPQQKDVCSLVQALAIKELLELGQCCHLTCDAEAWRQSLFYGLNVSTRKAK